MDNIAPKRLDAKPHAIPDGESALSSWPTVYDLNDCTFTYKGRSVSGIRLAAFLGLVESADSPDPARPESMPATQS